MVSKCDECDKKLMVGDWPYCPHGSIHERPALQGPPTVVFYNPKTGRYSFPARSNKPTPKGYSKIELTTDAERARFEKKLNSEESAKMRENVHRERMVWEETCKNNVAELLKQRETMTGYGKELVDHCIKDMQERSQRMAYEMPSDSGFYIESRHYDNLKWSDRETGWKDRTE